MLCISMSVKCWQVSPAMSREHNEVCLLLRFYDSHDIWHFLSAIGLFISFMVRVLISNIGWYCGINVKEDGLCCVVVMLHFACSCTLCLHCVVFLHPAMYEGRSMNKLQNGVILLVFEIWNVRFLLNTSYKFYYDNVTVMSFINIKCSDISVKSIP